ncbi:MAG: hypothetical protein ACD_22C00043G0005 [uncultured bacterium]|nr:MAG: hypothetical protein ACD_22C00043G0005 [uncultured bacterium]
METITHTNKRQGFTLLELMLSVSIIAILSGVLIMVINPLAIVSKGRDAKRMEDLDAISKAILLALTSEEMTLIDNSACATCTSASGTQVVDGTGWVKFSVPLGKTGLAKFLPALPVDPINLDTNVYTFSSTVENYELNTVLESTDNATKMSVDGGDEQGVYEVGTSLTIL